MHLFVAQSTYHKPLTEIDPHLPAHAAWIKSHTAKGEVLGAGRQVPPEVGGVILFKALSAEIVKSWLAEDPYSQLGLASYTLTEFAPRPEPISSKALADFMAQG
jgi:uncharacterized protein YciI